MTRITEMLGLSDADRETVSGALQDLRDTLDAVKACELAGSDVTQCKIRTEALILKAESLLKNVFNVQ